MAHSPVQRFRQRKLSTRQSLLVLRQGDIDSSLDDGTQRHIPRIETGVEKGEEVEHHLQAAISASAAAATGGKVAQIYIPTPETIRSDLQYTRLYTSKFIQPTTYVRFSSTVEDCVGSFYCLNAEDEALIKSLQKGQKYDYSLLSNVEAILDQFENICPTNEISISKDMLMRISLNNIGKELGSATGSTLQELAGIVYDYWKLQRSRQCHRPLLARLKIETGRESDDSDPYVCFRRREVRQIRKTRGRDAHVYEKMRKLRRELEDARQIVKLINQRELRHMDSLGTDEHIFKSRLALKELKRNLSIKGDDGDFISQLSISKPRHDGTQAQRVMPGTKFGQPQIRTEKKPNESSILYLNTLTAKKNEQINKIVEENTERHINWNKGWIDATWKPLLHSSCFSVRNTTRGIYDGRITAQPIQTKPEPSLYNTKDSSLIRKTLQTGTATDSLLSTVSSRTTVPTNRRKGRGGRFLVDRQPSHSLSSDNIMLRIDRFDEHPFLGYGYDSFYGRGNNDVSSRNGFYYASRNDDSAVKYRVMIRTSTNREITINTA